jgi:hypothetical protein
MLYRNEVLDAARKELQAYQDRTPGNVFAILIDLLVEDDESDSTELAMRLSRVTGSPCTPENARKQKERARRKFAEILQDLIRTTLEEPTPQEIENELRILGILDYVAGFLPRHALHTEYGPVTLTLNSDCKCCKHYRQSGPGHACEAFPGGIPPEIIDGRRDHRKPYPGDRNIQFETK